MAFGRGLYSMAIEQKKAKGTKPAKRKLDPEMEELRKPERGKKKHQQLKAYMVLECLMRETNEKKPLSARDIVAYLEDFGISAEATSVRNDIKEINYVMYMLEYGCTIDVAIEELDSGDYEEDKFIKYSHKKKGYYISRYRDGITENDIRVIAECIYASRFVTEKQADHLVDIACSLVNARTAERIKNDIRVAKEEKEVCSDVFYKVSTILEALSEGSVDNPHMPEKISFSFQEYVIDDAKNSVIKQNKSYHTVSPYELYNGDDCYRLWAFDEEHRIKLFQVDLMTDIRLTGETLEGEELELLTRKKRKNILHKTNRRVKPVETVLLCPISYLTFLAPVFGTGETVEYSTYDDTYFLLKTIVCPDKEFFRLLTGFQDKIKILEPDSLIEEYLQFLDRPRQLYNSDVPKMSLFPNIPVEFDNSVEPKVMIQELKESIIVIDKSLQKYRELYGDKETSNIITKFEMLKQKIDKSLIDQLE